MATTTILNITHANGTAVTNGHVASSSLSASTERIQIVDDEKKFTFVYVHKFDE